MKASLLHVPPCQKQDDAVPLAATGLDSDTRAAEFEPHGNKQVAATAQVRRCSGDHELWLDCGPTGGALTSSLQFLTQAFADFKPQHPAITAFCEQAGQQSRVLNRRIEKIFGIAVARLAPYGHEYRYCTRTLSNCRW